MILLVKNKVMLQKKILFVFILNFNKLFFQLQKKIIQFMKLFSIKQKKLLELNNYKKIEFFEDSIIMFTIHYLTKF